MMEDVTQGKSFNFNKDFQVQVSQQINQIIPENNEMHRNIISTKEDNPAQSPLEKKKNEKIIQQEKSQFQQFKPLVEKEKENILFMTKEESKPQNISFECEIEKISEVDEKFFEEKQLPVVEETRLRESHNIGQKSLSGYSAFFSDYSQNDNLLNTDIIEKPDTKSNESSPRNQKRNDNIQAKPAEKQNDIEKDNDHEKEINQQTKPEVMITSNQNSRNEEWDTQEFKYGTNSKLNISDCEEEKDIVIEIFDGNEKHRDNANQKKTHDKVCQMAKKATLVKLNQSEPIKKETMSNFITEEINQIFKYSTSDIRINTKFDPSKFIALGNYEKKENLYNEIIQDFNVIFKEKNYLYLRRRLAFLKDEYFSYQILKEKNIIDCKKKLHVNYPKLLEERLQMYEEKQEFNSIFHEVICQDNHKMAEVIQLLEKKSYPVQNYLLIGNICGMRYYSDKYNLTKENHLHILERAVEDFAYWREIHCDGDSFYRGFMFALFENYIFLENFHEIKKIIYDIYVINQSPEGSSIFKSKAVDFRKVLVIFYLLIDHIQKGNWAKSYNILVKAYHLEDKSFDNVLIGYMRYVIWSNIAELNKKVQMNKQRAANVKNYVKKSKSSTPVSMGKPLPEYDEISFNAVLCFQNEPVKLVMSTIPFLFNVNLEIFILEGSIKKGNDLKNSMTYNSIKFTDNTMNDLPVIGLSYNLSSYARVYPRSSLDTALKILKPEIEELNKTMDFQMEKNVIIPGDEAYCEKCGTMTQLVYLTKYSYRACLLCLKNYVNEIIEMRMIIYNKENFNNREYYSRQIELKENVYLSDYDITTIFNTNIANLLLLSGNKLCFACDKIFQEDLGIYKLTCNCQFCKDCLIMYHKEATQGYDYLNKFERILHITEYVNKTQCCCNLPFNFENSFSILQMKGDLKNRAKKRLDRIVSAYCMRCYQCLIQAGDEIHVDSTRALPYRRFKIILGNIQNLSNTERNSQRSPPRLHRTNSKLVELNIAINEANNNSDASNGDHVLCESCIEQLLRQESAEMEKIKKNKTKIQVDNNVKIIQCKICDDSHIIKKNDWNSMFKKPCCSGCVLF